MSLRNQVSGVETGLLQGISTAASPWASYRVNLRTSLPVDFTGWVSRFVAARRQVGGISAT